MTKGVLIAVIMLSAINTMPCPKWGVDSLKENWYSMFNEKYYRIHNEDLEVQGIFLLLEGAYDKVQQLSCRFSNTTALYKKTSIELEEKNQEINLLRKEISKKSECEKCCKLEKQLEEVTKKASEAQSRMNSIAKILCLGSFDSKNEEKRNSALSIVSQILLDSSPKRKRRCQEAKNSPTKENVLIPASLDLDTENFIKKDVDFGADGDVISETMTHTPLKPITNVASVKTPPNKGAVQNNQTPPRFSSSINLPVEGSQRIASVKKNLSADCINVNQQEHYSDIIEFSPPKSKKKGLSFNIDLKNVASSKNASDTTLDASLLEYVKDSRTELDKIWFDDEKRDDTIVLQKNSVCPVNEDQKLVSLENLIVEETPTREENKKLEKRKRADFWLLKEKRELKGNSKTLDGKKFKQTKLELGIKNKSVDISKLAGFEDGIQQLSQQFDNNKDDDIIPASPGSQISVAPTGHVINEINSLEPNSFHPIASSTQHSAVNNEDLVTARATSSSKSPDYVYKRDAVKKKCERARLPGWDCDECRKYYETMSLSPSKIKSRLNACSRHRDKYRPKLNETPPGFWNPLFPDTQECREKGMYISIHCPANRDK